MLLLDCVILKIWVLDYITPKSNFYVTCGRIYANTLICFVAILKFKTAAITKTSQ
jgi:hypothetical protein